MESLYDKYMSYQGPVKKMITLILLLYTTGILHDKKVSWQEYLICN